MFFYADPSSMSGSPQSGMYFFCPSPQMMLPMHDLHSAAQHMFPLLSRRAPPMMGQPVGRKPLRNPKQYKTVLCESWKESQRCNYGDNCQFAHGSDELRLPQTAPLRHPKYKTKPCDKFSFYGFCPYGARCNFIHGMPPMLEQEALPSPSSRSGSLSPDASESRPSSTFSWPSIDSLANINASIAALDEQAAKACAGRLPAFVELSQRQ